MVTKIEDLEKRIESQQEDITTLFEHKSHLFWWILGIFIFFCILIIATNARIPQGEWMEVCKNQEIPMIAVYYNGTDGHHIKLFGMNLAYPAQLQDNGIPFDSWAYKAEKIIYNKTSCTKFWVARDENV